jgi:hypothetical protein
MGAWTTSPPYGSVDSLHTRFSRDRCQRPLVPCAWGERTLLKATSETPDIASTTVEKPTADFMTENPEDARVPPGSASLQRAQLLEHAASTAHSYCESRVRRRSEAVLASPSMLRCLMNARGSRRLERTGRGHAPHFAVSTWGWPVLQSSKPMFNVRRACQSSMSSPGPAWPFCAVNIGWGRCARDRLGVAPPGLGSGQQEPTGEATPAPRASRRPAAR